MPTTLRVHQPPSQALDEAARRSTSRARATTTLWSRARTAPLCASGRSRFRRPRRRSRLQSGLALRFLTSIARACSPLTPSTPRAGCASVTATPTRDPVREVQVPARRRTVSGGGSELRDARRPSPRRQRLRGRRGVEPGPAGAVPAHRTRGIGRRLSLARRPSPVPCSCGRVFGPARALRAVGTARGQRQSVAHRLLQKASRPRTPQDPPEDFQSKKKTMAQDLEPTPPVPQDEGPFNNDPNSAYSPVNLSLQAHFGIGKRWMNN